MFVRTLLAAAGLAVAMNAFPQNEPIRIGAFLSVTGPAAFLGDPEQKTLELYVEKLNAAGGRARAQAPARRLRLGGRRREGARLREAPDRAGQGRRAGRRLDHRRDHGGGAARRRRGRAVHLARRRGGDRRAGEEMGVQDAAHRPHGLREDLRRHARARRDESRAHLGRRRLRQVDARRVPEGGGQARRARSSPTRPTARATPT